MIRVRLEVAGSTDAFTGRSVPKASRRRCVWRKPATLTAPLGRCSRSSQRASLGKNEKPSERVLMISLTSSTQRPKGAALAFGGLRYRRPDASLFLPLRSQAASRWAWT
jgi:hypothetical protein